MKNINIGRLVKALINEEMKPGDEFDINIVFELLNLDNKNQTFKKRASTALSELKKQGKIEVIKREGRTLVYTKKLNPPNLPVAKTPITHIGLSEKTVARQLIEMFYECRKTNQELIDENERLKSKIKYLAQRELDLMKLIEKREDGNISTEDLKKLGVLNGNL